MHSRAVAAALLMFGCFLSAYPQSTQLWTQNKAEDFEKGSGSGVAIRSDGTLMLAPASKQFATLASTYIWALASDRGRTLVAAGSPARLYSVSLDGKATSLFEGKELQTQAVLLAPDGTIYFATSPDGKIYRLRSAPGAVPETFFDPKEKYIWALAMDTAGNLYAGTGETGDIYKISSTGNANLFFKSDEAHIRSLAFDKSGNLIAGSDGNGLIFRIDPKGQGFVLFSAPKKEITSLLLDEQGNIFAASTGDKRPAISTKGTTATTNVSSEVDRISSDGSSLRLWSSKDELAYALAFDSHKNLLIGTGNKGKVYSLPRDGNSGVFSSLLSMNATQVTAFATGPENGIVAATSNLGKLALISNQPPQSGSFESDTFDAKTFARWGRVEARGSGRFEIAVRTGNVDNPDRNWSPWVNADLTGKAAPDVPGARFAQWRATLYPGALLDSVSVNYRQKNIAPAVDEVTVTVSPHAKDSSSSGTTATPSATEGVIVRWTAHDDNNDDLRYSVLYRPAEAQRWVELRANLKEKQASFDPTLFPDGNYQIRVVATDAASRSTEDALTGERDSSIFSIDSTPPKIDALQAVYENEVVHVSFRATDSFSAIKRAEYSIDAGEWQTIDPVGDISDAVVENYDFEALVKPPTPEYEETAPVTGSQPKRRRRARTTSVPAAAEHLLVVRVYDRFDNVSTAKTLISGSFSTR